MTDTNDEGDDGSDTDLGALAISPSLPQMRAQAARQTATRHRTPAPSRVARLNGADPDRSTLAPWSR